MCRDQEAAKLHTHIFTYIYNTYIYAYIYKCICMNAYITYLCIYAYMQTCTYMHVHVYAYIMLTAFPLINNNQHGHEVWRWDCPYVTCLVYYSAFITACKQHITLLQTARQPAHRYVLTGDSRSQACLPWKGHCMYVRRHSQFLTGRVDLY